jgi:hypothetical protein
VQCPSKKTIPLVQLDLLLLPPTQSTDRKKPPSPLAALSHQTLLGENTKKNTRTRNSAKTFPCE